MQSKLEETRTKETNNRWPCISVILPVRNEARFVRGAIESLLRQETRGFDLEILVIDGKSTDGTRALIEELKNKDSRVRMIVNEKGTTPAAFNMGLRAARGEYVCLMGAHSVYQPVYLSVCFEELISRGLTGCSGYVVTRPARNSRQARLVAWLLSHPFGTSAHSTRTAREGYTATVSYPLFRKKPLLDLGGYNESLIRNQDNDMNYRLRASGHKLYLTSKTSALYFPKASIPALLQFAFRNGYWNALTLRSNPRCLSPRHLIPFAFCLAMTLMAAMGALHPGFVHKYAWLPLELLVGSYFAAAALATLHLSVRERSVEPLLTLPLFFPFHCSYGLGTFVGLLRPAQSEFGWLRRMDPRQTFNG